jgi:hypothetical protein
MLGRSGCGYQHCASGSGNLCLLLPADETVRVSYLLDEDGFYAGVRRICQQADGVRGVPWVRPTRLDMARHHHGDLMAPKGLAIARWHSTLGNAWPA